MCRDPKPSYRLINGEGSENTEIARLMFKRPENSIHKKTRTF